MKRAIAMLLLSALLMSLLAGCAQETPKTTTEVPAAQTTTQPVTETTEPRPTPGYVTEPVTIKFWYNYSYSSGQNALLLEQVDRFNENNELGITVEATGYTDYYSIKEALETEKPDLATVTVETLVKLDAEDSVADMADYVWRDGWDQENFPASLRGYMQHYEDKVICFPYAVDTYVLYYNKAYYQELPESMDEWVEMAKEITEENPGVFGMYFPRNLTGIQQPIFRSLGASGLFNETGDGVGDGFYSSLEKYCTDWISWLDAGFCAYISTNAGNPMTAFYSGNNASYPASSSDMAEVVEYCGYYGTEFGVAPMVGYGGYSSGLSLATLVPLDNGDQQKIAATWEFIKFLYEDQQVVEFALETGYLPVTYSAAEYPDMVAYWEENPYAKVGFDQLEYATGMAWSHYLSEWYQEVNLALVEVVLERKILPDEAVDNLRRSAEEIFP